MPELFVARASEIGEGQRRIVKTGQSSIGIIRAKGRVHAYLNHCPHQGGPVCEGLLIHRVEEDIGPDRTYRGMRYAGEVHLVCPWHGWEFDIESGRCAGDRGQGLQRVTVIERDEAIYVIV
jgi:nitrite reductase (NADH) small subunit